MSSYDKKKWGRERGNVFCFYREPKQLKGTFVLNWAKEKIFEYPTGVEMPLEYKFVQNYNHLVRTMTTKRFRNFVLTTRSKMGKESCKPFLEHVLSDVNCLQFDTREVMTDMTRQPNEWLENSGIDPRGYRSCNDKGSNRSGRCPRRGTTNKAFEERLLITVDHAEFVLYEEEKYTPINVRNDDLINWLLFLVKSRYAEEIWSNNILSLQQDLNKTYEVLERAERRKWDSD